MNTEEKLINILTENKKLMEELKMKKRLKEQNEEDKDIQAPVSPTDSAPKSAGTTLNTDKAPQDDLNKKYEENESDKDTQAPISPTDNAPKKDGATPNPEGASKDDVKDTKLAEQADTDEDNTTNPDEDKKLTEQDNVDETDDDKKLEEKFKEMEEDMGKVTDILEVIKQKVDELEQTLNKNKDEPIETPDEPEPPMTESRKLRDVFVETITSNPVDFGKIAREVIY